MEDLNVKASSESRDESIFKQAWSDPCYIFFESTKNTNKLYPSVLALNVY